MINLDSSIDACKYSHTSFSLPSDDTEYWFVATTVPYRGIFIAAALNKLSFVGVSLGL
jgi:hypothetical protein